MGSNPLALIHGLLFWVTSCDLLPFCPEGPLSTPPEEGRWLKTLLPGITFPSTTALSSAQAVL